MKETPDDKQRDEVLRQMLATPPQPKKPSQNKKLAVKAKSSKGKER